MTLYPTLALIGIMLLLAAIPSASVALVVSRSASLGIRNGIATALGITAGDSVFVFLAALGMTFIAETMGALFSILKLLGGGYLVWMGIKLIRSKNDGLTLKNDTKKSTLITSFIAGFVLTLGDIKAILFYASLLPTFIDLTFLTRLDIALLCLITIFTVASVKIVYAFAAQRIFKKLQQSKLQIPIRNLTGAAVTGAGVYLISKS